MHIVYAQFYTDRPTPDYQCLAVELRQMNHKVWLLGLDKSGNIALDDGEKVQTLFTDPRQYNAGLIAHLPILSSLFSRLLGLLLILRLRTFLNVEEPAIVQVDPAAVNWIWLLPVLMPSEIKFILDSRQTGLLTAESRLGKAIAWLKNQKRPFYARNFFDQTVFLHEAGASRVVGPQWKRWCKVVPMGVNSHFLEYDLVQTRQEHAEGSLDSRTSFLYIGRLNKIRKLDRLFLAAQFLKEQTSNFVIRFIGIDESEGYYTNLIKELGLSENVSILPPVPYEEVGDVIAQHDVMLAYVPENPPDWMYHPTLKVIEYSAMGAPIIATNFAPNSAIVTHEENGLLVENTPSAFANAMKRFIDEPHLLETSYLEGKKNRYAITWRHVAEMYVKEVYQPLHTSNTDENYALRGISSIT